MRVIAVAILCTLFIGPQSGAQCRADISGIVINDEGKAVPGSSVSFQEHKDIIRRKAEQWFETDSSGIFHVTLDLTAPGSYWIVGKKEEAGYPNTTVAFYNNREPRLLVLKCGITLSHIVVELGPKAAYITHINVLSADTGRPIADASITFRRLTSPFAWISSPFITTAAAFKTSNLHDPGLPVPSNVELEYQVSAAGYSQSTARRLHLTPLQEVEISVHLQRIAPASRESR